MKEYKHAFRRWIQKMYIDSVRKMDYERGTRTKYELDCMAICKKLIDKPDTQLLMTPLSNKKYIYTTLKYYQYICNFNILVKFICLYIFYCV